MKRHLRPKKSLVFPVSIFTKFTLA